MSQPKSDRNNSTQSEKYQSNSPQHDTVFAEIVQYILQHCVLKSSFNKVTFKNLLEKFGSSQKGRLFVRLIPYFPIENKSYRSLGVYCGVSHETIRKWVYEYAPEILNEKGGIGGDK